MKLVRHSIGKGVIFQQAYANVLVQKAVAREAVGKRRQEGRRTSWQACRVLPCIRHVQRYHTMC